MEVDYLVISIIALLSFVLFILQQAQTQEPLTIKGMHSFYYPAMPYPQIGYKTQGFRKPEYKHGYQMFGDKLWRCNDDPDSLNTVPCGPNDNSLWRECILKKIAYNEKQCDDYSTSPSRTSRYRKEVATNCAYHGPSSTEYTKNGRECSRDGMRLPHGDCTPYVQNS